MNNTSFIIETKLKLASFNTQETQCLKPFRAKLINEYYKQCPVSDRSLILNALRRRDKPFL